MILGILPSKRSASPAAALRATIGAGCIALAVAACGATGGQASPPLDSATLELQRAVQTNLQDEAFGQIGAGANVSAVDETGRPPLAWAVLYGSVQTAEALLAHGADPLWRGRDGTTFLHLVVRWPVLEPTGSEPRQGDPPSLAGKLRLLRPLLDRGIDPRATDGLGMTALHYAVLLPGTEPEVVPFLTCLLVAGAVPDARNVAGLTPADLADRQGRVTLAQTLRDPLSTARTIGCS